MGYPRVSLFPTASRGVGLATLVVIALSSGCTRTRLNSKPVPGPDPAPAPNCVAPNAATPFISIWRTTSAGESIQLPLSPDYSYDFMVDWGDGTRARVRAHDAVEASHTYVNAGDHTMTWTGCADGIHMAATPQSAGKLIEVRDLGRMGWQNLSYAFMGANNLASFAGGDTSGVTDMTFMFGGASSLVVLDAASWDTSKVTSMARMFEDATSITRLDLGTWDTSKVTSFAGMFANASSLQSVGLSGWDTAGAEEMNGMFAGTAIERMDLSHFKTTNVIDMRSMFYRASSLVSLDLRNWSIRPSLVARDIFVGTPAPMALMCSQGSLFGKPCTP